MPPSEIAKKAAKKGAKKAAKKGAKKAPHHHHEGPRHEGKDLRRAYEHLGRLSALESSLTSGVTAQIRVLTELAERSLHADDAKSAADLLRAGEHLVFGSLASKAKARKLSETLEATLNAEYEHLVDKAAEHWERHAEERPAGIEAVYESMVAAADAAFTASVYRRALEFARGAEALAHVTGGGPALLEEGESERPKRLKG